MLRVHKLHISSLKVIGTFFKNMFTSAGSSFSPHSGNVTRHIAASHRSIWVLHQVMSHSFENPNGVVKKGQRLSRPRLYVTAGRTPSQNNSSNAPAVSNIWYCIYECTCIFLHITWRYLTVFVYMVIFVDKIKILYISCTFFGGCRIAAQFETHNRRMGNIKLWGIWVFLIARGRSRAAKCTW